MSADENNDPSNTFSRWEQYEALEGYTACALWSSSHYASEDSDPIPFDELDYTFAESTADDMANDLFPFMLDNAADLHSMPLAQIGHATRR